MLNTCISIGFALFFLLVIKSQSCGGCKFDTIQDMINMVKVDFVPTVCEWIHAKGSPKALLAVYVRMSSLCLFIPKCNELHKRTKFIQWHSGERGSGTVRVYAPRDDFSLVTTLSIHQAPITAIKVLYMT